jgi:hypothetical protein
MKLSFKLFVERGELSKWTLSPAAELIHDNYTSYCNCKAQIAQCQLTTPPTAATKRDVHATNSRGEIPDAISSSTVHIAYIDVACACPISSIARAAHIADAAT